MSEELKSMLRTLQLAATIRKRSLRKAFLIDQYKADPTLYKALKEIAVNLVNKNVNLSEKDKSKLRKFRKCIIKLATDRAKGRQKQHVAQSGGYLPIVIPLVTSLLSTILNG